MNTRPITWPTVPKGKDRVRICLHAGNTRNEVERLVDAMVGWAQGMMSAVAKANL
jgi:8-amino-7-oxononanoate synthase